MAGSDRGQWVGGLWFYPCRRCKAIIEKIAPEVG